MSVSRNATWPARSRSVHSACIIREPSPWPCRPISTAVGPRCQCSSGRSQRQGADWRDHKPGTPAVDAPPVPGLEGFGSQFAPSIPRPGGRLPRKSPDRCRRDCWHSPLRSSPGRPDPADRKRACWLCRLVRESASKRGTPAVLRHGVTAMVEPQYGAAARSGINSPLIKPPKTIPKSMSRRGMGYPPAAFVHRQLSACGRHGTMAARSPRQRS